MPHSRFLLACFSSGFQGPPVHFFLLQVSWALNGCLSWKNKHFMDIIMVLLSLFGHEYTRRNDQSIWSLYFCSYFYLSADRVYHQNQHRNLLILRSNVDLLNYPFDAGFQDPPVLTFMRSGVLLGILYGRFPGSCCA